MVWNDGLVNAFPIPLDRLKIDDAPSLALEPTGPFPFFDLPSELRNRVYFLVLFGKAGDHAVQILKRNREGNGQGGHIGAKPATAPRSPTRRISILLANKISHEEAAYVLYTTVNFRIFPLQDFSRVPSVRELPPHYRKFITNLELILGSSWTDPPKAWRVTKVLAKRLVTLDALQTLKIFVQADPSHPAFEKYRKSYSFYTDFCGELLERLLNVMPQVDFVEFDAYPSVDQRGPLVTRLRSVAEDGHKIVKWRRRQE